VFVTNHVLSGVAIGQLLARRPVTAFAVGVASHLALDAVPHWGCETYTPEGSTRLLRAARVDGVLGLCAMALGVACVSRGSRLATMAAVAGAVVLDVDKPAEHFFDIELFPRFVNRVHGSIQNESPDGLVREVAWGVAFVGMDAAAVMVRRRLEWSRPAP
jgi:hypothetical protein